ncbi:MAG TPA: hypothetical protein VIP51_03255 [Eoetvoesiella sp.]
MSNWYILPNGNIKHLTGLEIEPENDWFPTADSLEYFSDAQRAGGKTEVQIIQYVMSLALECEQWAKDNLA